MRPHIRFDKSSLAPLVAFLVFFICVFATAPSFAEGENGFRKELAASAARGEWAKIADSEFAQKIRPDDRLALAVAYAFHAKGDDNRALKLLESRTDQGAVLLRGAIENKPVNITGLKEPAAGYSVFFLDVPTSDNGISFGVFPKKAERAALKKAFYQLLPEPDVSQVQTFENRIFQRSAEYLLAGEVIHENHDRVSVAAFIDTVRLSLDLGLKKKDAVAIGVLTRSGADSSRKGLVKWLATRGFVVEDLGRGDYYGLGDRKRLAGIVVEIKEDSKVSGVQLKASLRLVEANLTFMFYNTSSDQSMTEFRERASVISPNEDRGRELAFQKAYEGSLSEVNETLAELSAKVEWRPGGMPVLDASVASEKVFTSAYKFYAKGGAGELTLKNNTDRPVENVKLSFMVKDYMDFPSETDMGVIPPKGVVKRPFNAVFNSRVIDVTADTYIQSEIKVSYASAGKADTLTITHPVYFYDRHAIVWDDKGKVSAFVTPKDPVILNFAGSVVSGYRGSSLPKNLVMARALFDAMGVMGISYVEDPNNPYQAVSGLATVVDFVQFPRETLARKAGDCDDLTALYSSLLESIGIRTALIDAPGHIYMMFDSGIPEEDKDYFGFPEAMFITRDGSVWVPVEVTLSGSSFTDAWKKAATEYNKERESDKLIDLRLAWRSFSPPSFPPTQFEAKATRDEIERKFPGELDALEKKRVKNLGANMKRLGPDGLKELMIIYGKAGLYAKALEAGDKLLSSGRDPEVINNMGNVHYLSGDVDKAVEDYKEAASLSPEDAEVWVNLSRAYLKKGARQEAKDAFNAAMRLDPKAKDSHVEIYMELEK